jgi:hypothetical protein
VVCALDTPDGLPDMSFIALGAVSADISQDTFPLQATIILFGIGTVSLVFQLTKAASTTPMLGSRS